METGTETGLASKIRSVRAEKSFENSEGWSSTSLTYLLNEIRPAYLKVTPYLCEKCMQATLRLVLSLLRLCINTLQK